MRNSSEEIVNGANPSLIWTQYMYFLNEKGNEMEIEYKKRMKENKPITWNDLDIINKEIHYQLDYLMTGSEKFKLQEQKFYQKNKIKQMIKESVKQVLREMGEDPHYTEGAMVRQYSPNMLQVTSKNCTFYVDKQGKFYDENGQPTNNVHCLCDNDASNIAHELNQKIGNMFHYDMFRRQR